MCLYVNVSVNVSACKCVFFVKQLQRFTFDEPPLLFPFFFCLLPLFISRRCIRFAFAAAAAACVLCYCVRRKIRERISKIYRFLVRIILANETKPKTARESYLYHLWRSILTQHLYYSSLYSPSSLIKSKSFFFITLLGFL